MKTITILSALIALMLSTNIYASEPSKLRNEITTEFGKRVEQIAFAEGSNLLNKRSLSDFNHEGQLTQSTTYKWSCFEGWLPVSKRVYNYTPSNDLSAIEYTTWSEKTKDWSAKSKTTSYNVVAADGSLLLAETK